VKQDGENLVHPDSLSTQPALSLRAADDFSQVRCWKHRGILPPNAATAHRPFLADDVVPEPEFLAAKPEAAPNGMRTVI
jgi:hypothetical protein